MEMMLNQRRPTAFYLHVVSRPRPDRERILDLFKRDGARDSE